MQNQSANRLDTAVNAPADRQANPSAILVLGMHRSGTSAVTGTLGLLGAQMPNDPLPPIADANATGYWESASIVITHDRLLNEIGLRWNMPMLCSIGHHDILEKIDAADEPTDWCGQLIECVRDVFDQSENASPVVIKDPRMCRLVPLWKRVLAKTKTEPLFVLPIRHPAEIAESLRKRDGIPPEQSLWIWLDHVLRAELETRGSSRVFIRYGSLLSDWRTVMHELNRTLGLDLKIDDNADKVDAFLSASHRHHRASQADFDCLPRIVITTFNELDAAAAEGREPNTTLLDKIAQEFDDLCRLSGSWIQGTQEDLTKASHSIHQLNRDNESLVQDLDKAKSEAKSNAKSQAKAQRDQITKLKAESAKEIDSLKACRDELSKTIADQEQRILLGVQELENTNHALHVAQSSIETKGIALHAANDEITRAKNRISEAENKQEKTSKTLESIKAELKDAKALIAHQLSTAAEIAQELQQTADDRDRSVLRGKMLNDELTSILESSTARFALRKLRASHTDKPTKTQILGRRSAFITRMLKLSAKGPRGIRLVREVRSLMNNPDFNLVWYRDHYADVLTSGLHPAEHYVLFGRAEGRAMNPSDLADADLSTTHEPSEELIASATRLTSSTTKTFSIIMPTWNRRAVISRAIDSVIKQSFESWQLIIADDGSTDGTEALLKENYREHFESGKIIFIAGKHAGVSAARNLALEEATGDWIVYLDSDNEWREHYLLITASGYLRDPALRTAYASLSVDDRASGRRFIRASSFNWTKLAEQNFIDLNIFSHDRALFDELGGFDESLTRLVDWDLILRYTRSHTPKFNRPVLADYYIDKHLSNISLTKPLDVNKHAIDRRTIWDRIRTGSQPLRLAYVLWDFPALSQTFVLREIKWMIEQGHDVKVYFKADPDKATTLDFEVDSHRVKDHRELAKLLVDHDRNWAHSHFLYPASTLLQYPACEKAGVPFSIMPHAVDIFHHENRKRNLVAQISNADLCKRIVVYGDHHRDFLIEQGADPEKFIFTLQASDAGMLKQGGPRPARQRSATDALRIVCIGRLIEKKGIADLLDALRILKDKPDINIELTIFGYGPLDAELRAFCNTHRLDNVRFASTFEGADGLNSAFADADVFCLPCVEADNGDVDGFPTVFIEAAWYGLPILTTTVSAIPDYFSDGFTASLVPPFDPPALADRLGRLARSSPSELDALAARAHSWAAKHTGPDRTGQRLLDVITRPPIDIFMVTYHPDGLSNWSSTERAIRSVLKNTTTPHRLTIIDNASCPDAVTRLRSIISEYPQSTRLITLDANIGCGPASNIAVHQSNSDIVLYICSNEAQSLRVGWERPIIESMRDCPNAAIGGQLVHSPAWATGKALLSHESFDKFRNPNFAHAHPDRTFRHVQGGVWALRRSVFQAAGGFNESIPQGGMDVEYSYYLESIGHTLLDISEIVCLSNKTRPTIESQLDENTAVAHPIFDENAKTIEACRDQNARRCNLCGWIGAATSVQDQPSPHAFDCPECQATSTDRAAWRWLARSAMCHRDQTLAIINQKDQPSISERFVSAARTVQVRAIRTDSLVNKRTRQCDAILDTTDFTDLPDGYQAEEIEYCSQMLGIGTTPLRALIPSRTSPRITVVTKPISLRDQSPALREPTR